MAEIAIFQDSKGAGTCRSCGARIVWAETTQGKRMPFDRQPVAVSAHESLLGGRMIEYVDTTVSPVHFQTCPDAKKWRRRA